MTEDRSDDPYLGMRITPQVVLKKRLGQGAMGMVFLARHEGTESDVVVKILAPALASEPAIQERFRAEAVAVNMAQHPNIVRIWDVGQAGELHYVIMEYLEGITLDELFETQLPDLAHQTEAETTRVLTLLVQAAQALAAVHEVGVVHRDLKPDNMMVARRPVDGAETLKLLDFGLAKLSAGATLEGVTLGTPDYMPPEQIFSAAETDSAADVYALGTILYEAVMGQTPFVLPDLPRKPEVDEYIAAWTAFKDDKLAGPPALPGSVPAELRRLIRSMLAGDPKQRPTAAEVAARLEAFHLGHHRRKLQAELQRWQEQGQRPEDLLAGAALEEAMAGVDDIGALSDELRHFLLSSERREAPRRRRRVRRLLGITAGAASLLLLATVSLAFGYAQSRKAKRSTRVAKKARAEQRACSAELVRLADDANQLTRDVNQSQSELATAEKQVRALADNVKRGKASGAQLKEAVARLERIRRHHVLTQRKSQQAHARLQKLSAGLKKDLQACVTEQKRCTDLKKGLGKQLATCQASLRTVTTQRTTCDQSLATCTRERSTCSTSLTTCTGARAQCDKARAGCVAARATAQRSLTTCTAAQASAAKDLAACQKQLSPLKPCPAERGRCRTRLATCQASLRACRAPRPAPTPTPPGP